MKEDQDKIKELCKRVEEMSRVPIVKSKDFEHLSMLIYERTGNLLSSTTLKRIWGYLKEDTSTRRSTLDILAQYCGWDTYEEFLSGNTPEIESGFIDVKVLNAIGDLRAGNIVKLMWLPASICEIKYLGDSQWEVLRSEGTRLVPGDTFRCSFIMSGEPLFLENVVHNGVKSGVYVCGRRTGVRFSVK